jgi:2,3-bisphosphoglycerate-dependent phosphoglycerate mutase
MQFYFIRHGQSENNALWERTGSSEGRSEDPELTALGHRQAERLAQFLRQGASPAIERQSTGFYRGDPRNLGGFGFTHLYCSPMIRTVDTGTYVAEALDMPLVVWEDLHEVGGIFLDDEETGERIGLPGKDRVDLTARCAGLILPDGWAEGGWWNRPFEQREQRPLRAQRFFRDLMQRHGGRDHRVAVISHGGFYNHLMAVILDWPKRDGHWFLMNNVAITRIDFDSEVRVVYTNRLEFLPQGLIS